MLWPFGFGLSYADFAVSDVKASLVTAEDAPRIRITASIKNTSDRWAGKEVLQLYVSSPEGNLEQPYQAYKTCVKTPLIAPGETAAVAMELSVRDLASYDETRAAWILEPGDYLLRAGTSSRDTHVAAKSASRRPSSAARSETVSLCGSATGTRSTFSAQKGSPPSPTPARPGRSSMPPFLPCARKTSKR